MRFRFVEEHSIGQIVGVGLIWGACALSVCLSCRVVPAPADVGLPDGRVYEMVSPATNDEADVYVPNSVTEGVLNYGAGGIHTDLPFEASLNGEAIAYIGAPTAEGTGDTGAGYGNEYLAKRNADGSWKQVNLQPSGVSSVFFQAFSSDLSLGVLESGSILEPNGPPLAQEAPGEGYPVLYTHSDNTEGSYHPFFTAIPPEPAGEFLT